MDPFGDRGVLYPGLRPFRDDESGIFFGRERQTDEVLTRLQAHRFIAITGPSGCGKSSLIRAGVIPALRSGFMADAGSRWRICQLRPGRSPISTLARELAGAGAGDGAPEDPRGVAYVEAALRFGPLGLVNVVRESSTFGATKLLILVDQFEEIFRFRERSDPDEADAFVRLLLQAVAEPGATIYVVITMRSDYLGDCALFHGLPEAINDGQYLTPRLTRDQCEAAIVGPARVFGGDVEPALVTRLLNDFGPDPDQLPLLQHALMRMCCRRRTDGAGAPTFLLSTLDYEAVGGMARALSQHADEVLAELTAEQQHNAEVLFRRLTERGVGKRDTRAPALLGDVRAVAHATLPELRAVIELFRGEGRNFVTPADGPLQEDTLLDIGHESLIRLWTKLGEWVVAESRSAGAYRRLLEWARLWKAGSAGLWGSPDLDLALAWERREHPDVAWAARYASDLKRETAEADFGLAMEFLRASEHQWEATKAIEALREDEEKRREVERARQEAETLRLEGEAKAAALDAANARAVLEARHNRALRRIVVGLAAAVLALAAAVLVHRWLYVWEHAAHFASFSKRWGAPVGIGELSSAQVKRRAMSFRIVRRGLWGPVIRMESVDGSGRLTSRHGVGTYLSDPSDVATRKEVWWEFVRDGKGKLVFEVARDQLNRQVWSFVYLPRERTDAEPRARFFGPAGAEWRRSGQCASQVTFEYTERGDERRIRYFDRNGRRAPGRDDAIAQERHYDEAGNITRMISLDEDGKPMRDRAGNAELQVLRVDALGNSLEEVALDERGAPTVIRDGWSRLRSRYDGDGNPVELTLFDEADRPTLCKAGWHRRVTTYDDRGWATEELYWGTSGEPVAVDGACHRLQFDWDEVGHLAETRCLDVRGRPAPNQRGAAIERYTYEKELLTAASYFDGTRRPIANRDGFHRVTYRYDSAGNWIEAAYHAPDGSPAIHRDGNARVQRELDEDLEVRRVYLDTKGKPTVRSGESWAESRSTYDHDGNPTKRLYFDALGRPARLNDGSYGQAFKYDECGRETEVWLLGANQRRVVGAEGHAGWRNSYDALGRQTKLEYLAVDGRLTRSNEGVAGVAYVLDALGNDLEYRYFDPLGRPCQNAAGRAGERVTYDKRGNVIAREFFGIDGRPVSSEGYARETRAFDAGSRLVESAYFGAAGQPVAPKGFHAYRAAYDERGLLVRREWLGKDRRPLDMPEGFARIELENDDLGRAVKTRYLGKDGRPVTLPEGYARIDRAYDALGRLVEERYFDTGGAPARKKGATYGLKQAWDERGNVTSQEFLGPDGRPMAGEQGFCRMDRTYDDLGRVIERRTFAADGSPARLDPSLPYERERSEYGTSGRLVRQTFLTAGGMPETQFGRCAGLRVDLDEAGGILAVACLDARGQRAAATSTPP